MVNDLASGVEQTWAEILIVNYSLRNHGKWLNLLNP